VRPERFIASQVQPEVGSLHLLQWMASMEKCGLALPEVHYFPRKPLYVDVYIKCSYF
jgi:hypothetical protein